MLNLVMICYIFVDLFLNIKRRGSEFVALCSHWMSFLPFLMAYRSSNLFVSNGIGWRIPKRGAIRYMRNTQKLVLDATKGSSFLNYNDLNN